MVAGMLRVGPAAAADLASAIDEHTSGNPYEVVELLNTLRRAGVLTATTAGWRWDGAAVRAWAGPRWPGHWRRACRRCRPRPSWSSRRWRASAGAPKSASCGSRPARRRRRWTGRSTAFDEGVLVVEPGERVAVRFRHDRIREAVLSGLDTERRGALQLDLARRLVTMPDLYAVDAQQYLPIIDAVEDANERRRVVAMLHRAADDASLIGDHAMVEALLCAALRLRRSRRQRGAHGRAQRALVASRTQTVQKAKELADVSIRLRSEDVLCVYMTTIFGALTNRGDHFVPCKPLRRLVAAHLQIARLEDAAIPLHLVAFDLLGGSEVRLSRGSALDAVLAAAAIPGVLPPVPWGDHLLVDGGVVNNTPISHAIELGAERVFVLPTSDPDERGLAGRPRRPLDAAVQACKVLVGARLKADLVRYAAEAELIVLRAPNRTRVQPNDFDQAELLIADGLRAARRQLDALGERAAAAA